MRSLIIATALLTAFAAQAEPKRAAKEAVRGAAVKEAPADQLAAFQPKVIETKPIELAAPELEIKTKDLSENALDRRLAKHAAKSTVSDSSVMRDPAKSALMVEPADAA